LGQRLKRPTTLNFHELHTLGAGQGNKRLYGFFDALLCWALKQCVASAEIYENQHLSGSQVLSVEIIGEKFRSKVIQRKRPFPLWALNECDWAAEIYENSAF